MDSNPKLEILPTITSNPVLMLGQIRHFVTQCRKLLEEGGEPELAGMDDQVKELCKLIKTLDSKDAQQLRPRMESLVEELDELAYALTKQKDLVMAQLEELNKQQKANTAYQRVGATGVNLPPEEKEEE